ncbi:NitT/TauT family transport system substrate-binding protein [Micromonospora pisi]|uniref:NitT/TauT family transport system substrate-binding protein n=2 Tax=Micromonospora pisi TaxID=589240 RepID=A0A495JKJ6_9ACTN|nr:NitT/TauT family transport system substrate-binding protein [Micromonospora pisi]
MVRWARTLTTSALVVVLLGAGGCGEAEPAGDSAGQPPEQITYMTAFGAVGRDAFAWVAREKGYFTEAGLEVEIKEGAGNVTNLTALKSQQAQFAALDFTGAVIQAGKGEFTDWRAVAAVHQQTLVSIMTTKDTGITSPKDLEGRTIAAATGSVNQLLFPAYARLAGIDPTRVTLQNAQTTALNGLMASRQVDALGTFLLSRSALESAAKKEVVVLPYSDYLANLFGNAIITTPSLLADDPELVKRFTGAVLKGLRYSVEHPEEAAAILSRAKPTYPVAAGVGEIKAMTASVTPTGGAAIGTMDRERVAQTIAVLQESGIMPAGLTPEAVVDFGIVGQS